MPLDERGESRNETEESQATGRRVPLVSFSAFYFLPSPLYAALPHKHRVGLEPTFPHYRCGVLAAERPVRTEWLMSNDECLNLSADQEKVESGKETEESRATGG